MKIMKKHIWLSFIILFFMLSCSSVPITGRKQLNLIPSSSILSMSFQQYDEFLKTHQFSNNQQQTQMVKRVGARLQKAVEQYFAQKNMAYKLSDYHWEFNLVESEEVNAWCMPGGKVVIYTGMLPITQDESGMAVVMGHEIAHAVAEHGNERMSQGLFAQFGSIALSTALSEQPAATQELWMTAFGLGAQFGLILPYSRLHENEADHMGLIFMAMAGYDPNTALGFWERMSRQKEGQAPPEFMSTHPSDRTRIKNIQALIPEALRYYRK